MELVPWILFGLIALAIPFIVPLVSLALLLGLRRRLAEAERALRQHREAIAELGRTMRPVPSAASDVSRQTPAQPPQPAQPPPPGVQAPQPVQTPQSAPQPSAPAERPWPDLPVRPPAPVPPSPPVVERPWPDLPLPPMPRPAAATPVHPRVETPRREVAAAAALPASGSIVDRHPPLPPTAPPSGPSGFDWESLVGVKLFSAIAGIALVLAAIFFLRYSVEHGWLQPPVRVVIGIAVAILLLVTCELKAARRYPATANALDASAIAILFSTFFAAHALWNLIPGLAAFALMALVTAVAVLLAIRRESLFIAVLGLLGGFATPALLSTGENRPIPLFAYLLLLNVGLAWVAQRKAWPSLGWLTLVFTTIYQWGWVITFLTTSQLSLAMGIFLIFPLVSISAFVLGRGGSGARGFSPGARAPEHTQSASLERTALLAAALPLLFAIYLAATPGYTGHPWLLLSFLLLMDIGLVVLAIATREDLLFAASAVATLVVMAALLATSYSASARYPITIFTAAYVLLFAWAPVIAARLERPFEGLGASAGYVAPLLLFVFVVLVRIEPAFAQPWLPLGTLLGLLIVLAWRAAASHEGPLYFVAAFFAIAAQASWSASHLDLDSLRIGVAVFGVFGIVSLAVPLIARRAGHALAPPSGPGVVLVASLPLLLFFAAGEVAPQAIWALALLLAILSAGMFIESAAAGLPAVSLVGSVLSWSVLAVWWLRTSGSAGVLSSLTVLSGMTLLTLGGYAWAHLQTRATRTDATIEPLFRNGLFLGLIGHLFLLMLALNRQWAVPPWPLFGALALATIAACVVALAIGAAALHLAALVSASIVILAWTSVAGAAWTPVGIMAQAAAGAFALAWLALPTVPDRGVTLRAAAALVLFVGECTLMMAATGASPPVAMLVLAHIANLSVILALTWTSRWPHVALAVAATAWLAALDWQLRHLGANAQWRQLLLLAGAMYAVFIAYPVILGRRARAERDPYAAAVLASAMFFFAARAAFEAGGLGWAIGLVPVVQSAVLALLLRELLLIERPGERDLGRLALVAGASLAFVTVAIPLQLRQQWTTIGWGLEGAALAWLYRRIPHRGLLAGGVALLAVVFARLALNPQIFQYEPRGPMRILNWYLYAYLVCSAALLIAAWWYSSTKDDLVAGLRASRLLPAGAGILLFLLLNIEIADFYATGPEITFRFGAGVSQDLTYTIGWLGFGMALLAVGIWIHSHAARVAAMILIALTTFKCFLYDLASLGGLYRVASFVGLAMSLALVSLALQKYVLAKPKGSA